MVADTIGYGVSMSGSRDNRILDKEALASKLSEIRNTGQAVTYDNNYKLDDMDITIKFQTEQYQPTYTPSKITFEFPPGVNSEKYMQKLASLYSYLVEEVDTFGQPNVEINAASVKQAFTYAEFKVIRERLATDEPAVTQPQRPSVSPAATPQQPSVSATAATSTWRQIGTITPDIPKIRVPSPTNTSFDVMNACYLVSEAAQKLAPGFYEHSKINTKYCVRAEITSVSNKGVGYSYGAQQKAPEDRNKFPLNKDDVKGYEEGLALTVSLMKNKGVFDRLQQTQDVIPISSSSFPPSTPAGDALYIKRIEAFQRQMTSNNVGMEARLSPQDKKHLQEISARRPELAQAANTIIRSMEPQSPRPGARG